MKGKAMPENKLPDDLDEKLAITPANIFNFVNGVVRSSIVTYQGKEGENQKVAERFLFEGDYLRNFLDDFGFRNLRLDLFRAEILKGTKLVPLVEGMEEVRKNNSYPLKP
jgi:hypothetical protein